MDLRFIPFVFAIVWSIVYADSALSQSLEKVEKSSNSLTDTEWTVKLNQTLKEYNGQKLELDSSKQNSHASCNCKDGKCSCCAGIRFFGFDRQACAIMSYGNQSAFNVEVLVNNASIYGNKLSVQNQQLCIPTLRVTIFGPFDLCLRLHDVAVMDENRVHACLTMHGSLSQNPVINFQFNCMEMGAGGVALIKPFEGNYNESVINPLEVSNVTTGQTEPISGI